MQGQAPVPASGTGQEGRKHRRPIVWYNKTGQIEGENIVGHDYRDINSEGRRMKYIILACLFLSLSFPVSAKERVYTNADLKPAQPAASATQEPSRPPSPPPKGLMPAKTAPLFTNKSIEDSGREDNNEPKINLAPSRKPLPPAVSVHGLIGGTFAGMTAVTLILAAVVLIVWLVSLVDILRSEFAGNNKLVWFVAVTLLPLLGPVLYYFIGRGQRIRPGKLQEPA
jgi:hypothetical protein